MTTREQFIEELSYDPETGLFTRLKPVQGGRVGPLYHKPHKSTGYIEIRFKGKNYKAHRVAWLLTYGEWPPGAIDHRDRDKTNNRLSNLRIANPSQNRANAKVGKHSLSGIKGVFWVERDNKFQARIKHQGRDKSLGYFNTAKEAARAYAKASAELFGEFSAQTVTGE